jgi:c-di-GMP-related signal transduction protein
MAGILRLVDTLFHGSTTQVLSLLDLEDGPHALLHRSGKLGALLSPPSSRPGQSVVRCLPKSFQASFHKLQV